MQMAPTWAMMSVWSRNHHWETELCGGERSRSTIENLVCLKADAAITKGPYLAKGVIEYASTCSNDGLQACSIMGCPCRAQARRKVIPSRLPKWCSPRCE